MKSFLAIRYKTGSCCLMASSETVMKILSLYCSWTACGGAWKCFLDTPNATLKKRQEQYLGSLVISYLSCVFVIDNNVIVTQGVRHLLHPVSFHNSNLWRLRWFFRMFLYRQTELYQP